MLVVHRSGGEHVVHDCVIENEVSLSVKAVPPHVAVDHVIIALISGQIVTGPAHRRLALQIVIDASGLEALLHLCGEVVDGEVVNVLDGVDTRAIEVEPLQPPEAVSNHLLRGVAVLPIKVRHVAAEQAVEPMLGPVAVLAAAQAALGEPVRMIAGVRVVLVDVVDHIVHHHPNPMRVCRRHKRLQLGISAQPRIHRPRLYWPVAVVSRHLMLSVAGEFGSIGGGVERRQPERVHTEIVEVARLDHLGDAGEVSTLPISSLGSVGAGWVVGGVPIDEAVGHQHVDERIFPDEIGLLTNPEWHQQLF